MNAHDSTPMGMLNLPRFQGPGLNLFPTKKTLIEIGIANAVNIAEAAIENKEQMPMGPPKVRKSMPT